MINLDKILQYRNLHAEISSLAEEIFYGIKRECPNKLRFDVSSDFEGWELTIDGVSIHYVDMFEDSALYIEEFTIPYDVFVGNYWKWIEKTEKFW